MGKRPESPATKADLMDVRRELKTGFQEFKEGQRRLVVEMVNTNSRINHLDDKLSTQISDRASEILKAVDGFMAQVGKTDRRQIITDYRVDELDKRVKALESPRP